MVRTSTRHVPPYLTSFLSLSLSLSLSLVPPHEGFCGRGSSCPSVGLFIDEGFIIGLRVSLAVCGRVAVITAQAKKGLPSRCTFFTFLRIDASVLALHIRSGGDNN